MDLTDRAWKAVAECLPPKQVRGTNSGRPWVDARSILDGILWILRTGRPWRELPKRYPPRSTCHRRLQLWVRDGTLDRVLQVLAQKRHRGRRLGCRVGFMDGSYVDAKRGGDLVGTSRRGRSTRIMALCDHNGLPLAISIAAGNRHEVPLVDELLDSCFLEDLPSRIIADRAYDSAALREELDDERGVVLISPRRKSHRGEPRKVDQRTLRSYRDRWLIERLFAWLSDFRRVATRWERHAENYRGFLLLACMVILLRAN